MVNVQGGVVVKCGDCQERETWSRGLCSSCYTRNQRAGTLDEWPTKEFLRNPEANVRWAFGTDIEMIADIAVEFGYRLVPA